MMTEQEMEQLAAIMVRTISQARSVSDSEHYDHHRWIAGRIKADEWRADFWKQMVAHVAKVGIISLITASGVAAYLIMGRLIRSIFEWLSSG